MLRLLGLEKEPAGERACFSLALGLGIVAYGMLALGLLHLFRPAAALALLAALAAIGAGPAAALFRDVGRALRAAKPARPGSGLAWLAGGALALMLLAALVAALAPPAGSDWDGLSYHLADPAIYIRHGGIVPLFWESHSNFPFTIEMLYTLGLLFKSPGGARAFHWLFLVLTCVTLAAAWRRLWPDAPASARWLAPLALCSSPILLWTGALAYNDLALTAFELLALIGVFLWARGGRRGWLWAGALCLGFALGTKATALIGVLLLAPAVLVVSLRGKEGAGRALLRAAAFAAVAAAVGSPWYIRSYVVTLNPVYPFFYNRFPATRYWNAELARMYAATQGAFGIGHSWRNLIAAPWDLMARPDRFTDFPAGFPAFAVRFSGIGPALLGLAPAALILRRRDPTAALLLLFAAGYGLVWFKLSEQVRYLMPAFPALALAGARGVTGLWEERRIARYLAGAVLVAQALVGLGTGRQMAVPALPAVTGQMDRIEYLYRRLDVFPACDYMNNELPPDARVMLIGETRGFYLKRDYLWGDWGHHDQIPWKQFRDEAEMRRFLREKLGVTHVLVHVVGLPAQQHSDGWDRTLWDAVRAGTLVPIYGKFDPQQPLRPQYWVLAFAPGNQPARPPSSDGGTR